MTEGKIRRYTMAEINALIAAGQYFPVPDDAPIYELDEEFLKHAKPVGKGRKTIVELELTPSTVEQFRKSGPDYLERMAEVLERHAKKAS
jgi:uncharacterized protein (DUF4415 family)